MRVLDWVYRTQASQPLIQEPAGIIIVSIVVAAFFAVIELFHVVNLVDLWCLVVLGSTLAKSRAAQTTWIGIVRFPHQGGCGVGTIGIVRFPEHHLVCSSGPTLLLKPALTD